MSEAELYGLSGFSGSGKSSVRRKFGERGYSEIEVGEDVVIPLAKKVVRDPFKPAYDEALTVEGREIRNQIDDENVYAYLSNDFIADKANDIIQDELSKDNDVIVSGVRSLQLRDYIKESGGQMIAVEAPFATRLERRRGIDLSLPYQRDEKMTDIEGENFLFERDRREGRRGLWEILYSADERIINESNDVDLDKEVEQILDE